jgi:hypothetical protein
VGLGLAGGLLAELMLAGSLQLWHGLVLVADGVPPRDELAHRVLELVGSEREDLAVRDWLLFLARSAAGNVARRLEQEGYLTLAAPQRLWRSERWVPVDADCAFAPLVRVKSALDSTSPVAAQHVVLAGLAASCGLGHQLALYLPPGARHRLDQAVHILHPQLRELIAQIQLAVDSALLAHRV